MGKKWGRSRQIFASLVALSLALQSWTFLEWKKATTKSHSSDALHIREIHPVRDENVLSTSPWFVVDILSIGSNHRLEYLQAQRNTFAQHASVRHFFNATEDGDADPFCSQNLTKWQSMQISRFCHRHRKWNPKRQFLMSYWQSSYAAEMWLKRKAHPSGWMCAQTRPMQALHKLLEKYEALNQPYPDYLLLVDDDTYYNIPLLQRYLKANYPNSSKPVAIAGCMVRSPTNEINLTIPFGGYGLVLSKGYLNRLTRPIHCPDDEAMCHAIRKTNHLDERTLFQDGMSVSQLMNAYATAQPFQDWNNWTTGFCLHSDWLWGFISNFYNVSDHVDDSTYEDVPQARMEAYLGSEIDVGQPDKPRRICDFQRGNCHSQAQACHYSTPEEMTYITNIVKSRYPNEFPSSTYSRDKNKPPVIDILSLGSVERLPQLQMQYKIMGSHPRVRHFFNVTQVDDPSLKCHQGSSFRTEEATSIVGKCKDYLSNNADKSSFLVSMQHQSYLAGVRALRKRQLPSWICRQRQVLVGLLRLTEQYRRNTKLPDYLLLLEDDTVYNMDIFADLLASDERSRAHKLAPEVTWARSGCVQRYVVEGNSDDSILPLTEFGVVFPNAVLQRWTRPMSCDDGSTTDQCLLSQANIGMLGPMQDSNPVKGSQSSLIEWIESQTRLEEKYADGNPLLCATSSWLLTWMMGVFPRESYRNTLDSDGVAANNKTDTMTYPFLGSFKDEDDERGMCRYHGENCHEDAFYCKGVSAV